MFNSEFRFIVFSILMTSPFSTIANVLEITTSNTSHTNTGTIIGSASFGGRIIGIYNNGNQNIIINDTSGMITVFETTFNNNAQGVYSNGNSNILSNTGTIIAETTGDSSNAVGLRSFGNSNNLNNSGTIYAKTSGTDSNAYGIYSIGSDNTLTNSGIIVARGGDISRSIWVEGDNNTVNINKGSLLVGDIYTNGIDNKLNINLGAGASYAYQVTGPWAVTDLDNRPMVTGSAYAAGIGAQETAGQMLYQRASSITSSLDRRIRDYTIYNQSKVDTAYWVDSYYSDSSRGAGSGNSVQTNFSNQNYGFIAGARLPIKAAPIEAIINFEQSALNIANGNQNIDTSSVMVGLLTPKITEKWGINLSSKALMGWGEHNGDRRVYTNSLMYNGTQNVSSEYDSVYGIVGTALTSSYAFTNYLRADVLAGFDVDIQNISSYSESAYFRWNDRTLTQLQSRLQAGLTINLLNNTLSFFGRVGVEQRDLVGGQGQNYQIQGTNVTFNGGRMDNTYITGQLGSTYDVYKKVQLFGVVTSTNGLESVQAIQGNLGIRTSF
jgi:hypothetical protein